MSASTKSPTSNTSNPKNRSKYGARRRETDIYLSIYLSFPETRAPEANFWHSDLACIMNHWRTYSVTNNATSGLPISGAANFNEHSQIVRIPPADNFALLATRQTSAYPAFAVPTLLALNIFRILPLGLIEPVFLACLQTCAHDLHYMAGLEVSRKFNLD